MGGNFSWIKFIFVVLGACIAIVVGSDIFLNSSTKVFKNFKESQNTITPIGVMIENELSARPFQHGLSQADIIYEAPTEGNITRFLAIFLTDEYLKNADGKVGPIRSARPYFIDWMSEYGGLYAHVGGSDEALNRLWKNKNGVFDFDQFYYEKYFWRENVRKTALEHTVFTTLKVLYGAILEMQWISQRQFEKNKKEIELESPDAATATSIDIDFGLYLYKIQYVYDSAQKIYLRRQAGRDHIDQATGGQISPKTVVVQRVKSWPLNDDKFRIKIETIGKGEALIFTNGRVISAQWTKISAEDKTKFFSENGKEIKIPLEKGAVWFEMVPIGNGVEYD